MNQLLVDGIAYLALGLNLTSMARKGELPLRTLSIIANALYIIYGYLINATPLVVGCSIAVCLHGYHIRRLLQEKKIKKSNISS